MKKSEGPNCMRYFAPSKEKRMEETRKNKERFAWPETIWSDANILETIKVLALAEISS